MSDPEEVVGASHKEEAEESTECPETMKVPDDDGQQLQSGSGEPSPEPKTKPAAKSAADVRKERMERLRALHLRRVGISELTHYFM